jgi:curved DNA-binding protein CbpA
VELPESVEPPRGDVAQIEHGRPRAPDIPAPVEQVLEGAKGKYHHRKRSKELIVTIPPGMKAGQKIRLKGMGELGKDGGEPGDLYLKVKIKKPLFERIKNFLRIQPTP